MAFGKSPDDQSLLSPTGTFDQAVSNHCTTFVRYAPSISEHSVPRRRHGKWEKGFPDGKVTAPWNKMEERLRPSTAFSRQVWLPLQHNLASPLLPLPLLLHPGSIQAALCNANQE